VAEGQLDLLEHELQEDMDDTTFLNVDYLPKLAQNGLLGKCLGNHLSRLGHQAWARMIQ